MTAAARTEPAAGTDRRPDAGVPAALAALRRGEPVLLLNGPGAGELLIAAEHVTARTMAFLVRYTSGVACVAMPGERLDALRIPPQVSDDPERAAFGVSVDLRVGTTTGISATDRALTARALADPATVPLDLVRPGHVLPVRVRDGGVLERPAAPEAAVDLCRLAGLAAAGVLAAVEDGAVESGDCEGGGPAFAVRHGLVAVGVDELVRFREIPESPVRAGATALLPTAHGEFRAIGYLGEADGAEHLALVRGDLAAPGPVLVRVHSECLTGDVLGSQCCTCARDLAASLEAVARAGRGVLVYLRGRRRPGMGVLHALSACRPHDERDDRLAAHVLLDLGVRSAALLTDDETVPGDLDAYGIAVVGRVPLRGAYARVV
jgi:3,4-dihydroxy 2-butanone 4-phosphate synthase/GTP cyclohydrolase II